MIKVKFGYNNFDVLTPLMEGTEVVQGNFLDYISVNDRNYLVAQLENEEQSINVREVVQDLYANGKNKVYFNNYKNCDSTRLEEILNSRVIKRELVEFGIVPVLRDNGLDIQDSTLQLPEGNFNATGIDSDLFEQTRMSLRGCTYSFAQLAQRVNVLEADLREEQAKKLTK